MPGLGGFTTEAIKEADEKLQTGGTYSVHNSDFLTGANISVCLTKDFMEAVENDDMYELRFPDVENYTPEEMKDYNEEWYNVGDVRAWEEMRSEEHTSELQSRGHLVCRLLLEKKNIQIPSPVAKTIHT